MMDDKKWSVAEPCPKCHGASAEALKVTTNSKGFEIDLRCPSCRHEWGIHRIAPLTRPVEDRRRPH
jgi:tRNA(Ile2) C34 agmatinyltransferase TiaS